jgi:superoxide dismutase
LKEVQTTYIADKISKDFGGLEHLSERLIKAEKQIKSKKR